MSFQLEREEPVADGVRRIVREQAADAVERLEKAAAGADAPKVEKAVHEARKRGKEIRAVLRLVRPALGKKTFGRENAAVRDAGRELSAVRDAQVLVSAFDSLLDAMQDHVPVGSFAAVRAGLVERAAAASAVVSEGGAAVMATIEAFEAVAARAADWPLDGDGFEMLAPGLRRAYSEGRDNRAVAREDPTVESLHEWRKRVKDLWYHVRVLGPSAPGLLDPLAELLHHQSDLLGDDHDLAVLAETVQAEPAAFGGPVDAEALGLLAGGRRVVLQEEAFALGARLYAEKPKAFVTRLHAYWDAWRP